MTTHLCTIENRHLIKSLMYLFILPIPFFDIQESLGKWVVFNFESCNLKEKMTDVSQSVIRLCTFVNQSIKRRVTSSFW